MKLRRKLLAAGFAFGATALTLTTSTFAWYTTNTEVSVGSIEGATSATVDSTSIYIAAASTYASAEPGAAVADITKYSSSAAPVLVNSGTSHVLTPVSYAAVNTYNTMSAATGATSPSYTAITSKEAYIYEYVLRFQKPNATASTPVYVSGFTLTNSVGSATSAQVAMTYEAKSAGCGISAAGSYNVDMLHALKMTVSVTDLTADGTVPATPTTTTSIYDLDSFADATKDSNVSTTVNALTYYNSLVGTSLSVPDNYLSDATAFAVTTAAEANSTNSSFFAIPSTGYVEVRFQFWLDGWDEFCYDVCRQQGFTVGMQFSVSPAKSVLTTYTARTGKASS